MSDKNEKSETQFTLQLTEDYRIISDGMQYIVQQHVLVDPTSAPNWATRVAEAEASGQPLPDATVRKAWRNDRSPYYSLTDDGLNAAVNSIKHRIATDELGSVSLSEFIDFIRKQRADMLAAISGT